MIESSGEHIFDIKNKILSEPDTEAQNISILINIIKQGSDEANRAAMAIDTIARDEPGAAREYLYEISDTLTEANDVDVRYYLIKALGRFAETDPEALKVATEGLSHATEIREQKLAEQPRDELRVIRHALEAWTPLVSAGYDAPNPTIKNAIEILNAGEFSVIMNSIYLLERVLATQSNGCEVALEVLFDLVKSDDKTIREQAVLAVASAVYDGNINKHEEIESFLKKNLSEVNNQNRDEVERALDVLTEEP